MYEGFLARELSVPIELIRGLDWYAFESYLAVNSSLTPEIASCFFFFLGG